jgi:chemotaxis protein CheX
MLNTEINAHSPRIKKDSLARGEVSAMIGMSGVVSKDGKDQDFNGLIVLSFQKDVYLKVASAMLSQEFTDFTEDTEDVGAEIANIVMGNAKKVLAPQGYKIGMATPTQVKGLNHEIKYPPNTSVMEITISSSLGDFNFDICYREN